MHSPINQAHPVDIEYGSKELSVKQQSILDRLPRDKAKDTFDKRDVSMLDLAAFTAKTGNEFAMFTLRGERLVIRGNESRVYLSPTDTKVLISSGYRFSGHTHVGIGAASLIPSGEDMEFLKYIGQQKSSIYNAAGKHVVFNIGGK